MGIMGDTFTEQIVPVKRSIGSYAIQIALTVLTVFCFPAGLLAMPVLSFVGVLLIGVDWFVFRRLKIEYEYSYANGELDIAKIYSKQSRKNILSISMADVELAAPSGSAKLDGYRNLPTMDFTTGEAEDIRKAFVIVAMLKEKRTKLLLMPNEKMMKDMRTRAANKVFMN